MTRIAILCPGPSLTKVYTQATSTKYTYVIAVNEASALFACDLACFGELLGAPIGKHIPCFCPSIHMKNDQNWEDVPLPREPAEVNFSTVAALSLAINGMSVSPPIPIDIYGCDMIGNLRADGRQVEEGPYRWLQELQDIHWLLNRSARVPPITRICGFGV